MYWNHRIVHRDGVYGIHEVDYNDDDNIICIVNDPEPVFAESVEDLHKVLDMIREDITRNPQVLEYEKESKLAVKLWEKEYGRAARRKLSEDHESTP